VPSREQFRVMEIGGHKTSKVFREGLSEEVTQFEIGKENEINFLPVPN
jgi:hypothetical protein